MMENIRSFIAIEIPEALRQKLRDLLRQLKGTGADVKWVRPEGIHVTLKFLGAVDPETLDAISQALRPVVGRFDPFDLKAQGIGGFPASRNPRVIWAGLTEAEGAASRLQREIDATAAGLGFPSEDRPFKPHLTLGRVRSPKGKTSLTQMIEGNAHLGLGSFRVEQVVLFRSDLRPEGAVYSRLQEFPLKET